MSLQVNGLGFSIHNKKILDQIFLELKPGEFVGLIGPNGCGKSTLLKHIYRTYRPQRGMVFLDGKDLTTFSSREMAAQVAVMAQENPLEFDFEVVDMVLFGAYSRRKFLQGDSAKERALCEACLREVGLQGAEHRSYASLSGGEKQRVLLARVLMQQSPYLILDEPTNHLDVSYQYQMMEILKRQKSAVISSLHDLNLAALYCDRILLMSAGRIAASGTPEETLTQENIKKYFHISAHVTKNPFTGKVQIYYLPGGD